MLLNKDDFIKSHAKAGGFKLAEKMYNELSSVKHYEPEKVYISPTGGEIHVNGPIAMSSKQPETLQEKIARFDMLAAQVAASRAVQFGLAQEFTDDDDIDAEFDDFDDIIEKDDFGDIVAKPKVQPKAASINGSGQQIIDGDEPSQVAAPSAADPTKSSAMDADGEPVD